MAEVTIIIDGAEVARYTLPVMGSQAEPVRVIGLSDQDLIDRIKSLESEANRLQSVNLDLDRRLCKALQQAEEVGARITQLEAEKTATRIDYRAMLNEFFAAAFGPLCQSPVLSGGDVPRAKVYEAIKDLGKAYTQAAKELTKLRNERNEAEDVVRHSFSDLRNIAHALKELWPDVNTGTLAERVNTLIAYYQAANTKLIAEEKARAQAQDKLHDIDTIIHKAF